MGWYHTRKARRFALKRSVYLFFMGIFGLFWLAGCAEKPVASFNQMPARLTPLTTATHRDLIQLPPPKGKIAVSVYNFRDQTGQYKKLSNISSVSTAVTQGATAMLVKALEDSGWFVPVEREGLQNLLTERKIYLATAKKLKKNRNINMPPLKPAQLLMEGGIIAYETDVITSGLGAKYFGVSSTAEARSDQVTLYLRVVDIQSGRILGNVATSKTVLSQKVDVGLFRFVSFQRLLEAETGFSVNEPAQMCVLEALEKAVIALIIEGIAQNHWALKDKRDWHNPIIQRYLKEKKQQVFDTDAQTMPQHRVVPAGTSVPVREAREDLMPVKTTPIRRPTKKKIVKKTVKKLVKKPVKKPVKKDALQKAETVHTMMPWMRQIPGALPPLHKRKAWIRQQKLAQQQAAQKRVPKKVAQKRVQKKALKKNAQAHLSAKTVAKKTVPVPQQRIQSGSAKTAVPVVQKKTEKRFMQNLGGGSEALPQQANDPLGRLLNLAEKDMLAGRFYRPKGRNALEKYHLALRKYPQDARVGEGFKNFIVHLLDQADRDFEAMRLVEPAGQNALEKYLLVLQLDPENKNALEGQKRVAGFFLSLAEKALAQDYSGLAADYLGRASSILLNFSGAKGRMPRLANINKDAGLATDDWLQELRQKLGLPGTGAALPERERILSWLYRRFGPMPEKVLIQKLLTMAKADVKAMRLSRPPKKNALARFLTVLKIDPQNREAQAGIKSVVKLFLELAEADLKARRVIKPVGRNALERFNWVLYLDPKNQHALEGRKRIVLFYLGEAQAHLDKGKWEQAVRRLHEASEVLVDVSGKAIDPAIP
ncbi:CsgG/HfaB family protein [Magnetococcales bacterium HHB-1]